jgi:hypothetical protein
MPSTPAIIIVAVCQYRCPGCYSLPLPLSASSAIVKAISHYCQSSSLSAASTTIYCLRRRPLPPLLSVVSDACTAVAAIYHRCR